MKWLKHFINGFQNAMTFTLFLLKNNFVLKDWDFKTSAEWGKGSKYLQFRQYMQLCIRGVFKSDHTFGTNDAYSELFVVIVERTLEQYFPLFWVILLWIKHRLRRTGKSSTAGGAATLSAQVYRCLT